MSQDVYRQKVHRQDADREDVQGIHLWVKSNYSFLEGASHPEEIVDKVHALGMHALALTDRHGVYGLARAHVRAREFGMQVIPGAELYVHDHVDERVQKNDAQDDAKRVVVLAKTAFGYARLCRLITQAHTRGTKGQAWVTLHELADAAGDLIALCPHPELLDDLNSFGEDLFALCARHLSAEEQQAEILLRRAARARGVPCVGAVEVLYHDQARQPLQDVLTCIRHKCSLAEAGRRIRANAEHDVKSSHEMEQLFADAPELWARTQEIAKRCTFDLSQIRYRYPAEDLPNGETETSWLRALTWQGAQKRYDAIPDDVRAQLERELELIQELEYDGYFLTMHDIVVYCREHNILCQGRGSAANSAVCFCLGITAIDPVRMDLLFERFLSRNRAEPPDIDLDIEHERREEVIQYVYARYGRRHAAMVANVIRYRTRSAVRDVGKALGLPLTDLDSVTRLLRHYSDGLSVKLLSEAGLDAEAPVTHHLCQLVHEISDFPRHLSIHPGGFLLGHLPVTHIVPIEPATMEGRTVIQWDKYDVENLALFKVDLLGLGALTSIHRCFDLLRARGHDLTIATVPAEDTATYDMVSRGDTVGVFQIESRAQMAMLPRLKPRTFYDLVIEVAIVRPGPIQGDMVHPYLRRRNGEEEVNYPHPDLKRVLHKTLGVPIFQEQVMKLAIVAAGYSPEEADQLRRDMAAWRRSGRIEAHRERLISRMIKKGIPQDFAERVYSQIQGFGEYGFPESHAASFALLAYVTSWLRCHHPAAFTCALLNSQPMGFYSPASLVEDAKRHRIDVRPIDVQQSAWDCTLEPSQPKPAIRMGLRYVKGLKTRDRDAMTQSPAPYADLADFVTRTRLSKRSLVALGEAGALDGFGTPRRDAIWKVRALAQNVSDTMPWQSPSTAQFRSLSSPEEVLWDYRASHHSPRGHLMERFRPLLEARRLPHARALSAMRDATKVEYVGLVICRQRPGTASGVTFFTLEDETGFVNLVVWRDVFERFATVAKTQAILGVAGTLQVAEGVTHLVAKRLWAPPWVGEEVTTRSRDFH